MFERAWRSNSASTSINSVAIEPKIRFAESCASSRTAVCSAAGILLLNWNRLDRGLVRDRPHKYGPKRILKSVRSVIRKLHVYPKVFCFQRRNDLLKGIAILTRYTDRVPLNRGLHLRFRIFDQLYDVLRFFLRNALLDLRALTHGAAPRGLNRAVAQRFQRHAATHEFLLQDVVHIAQLRL